MNRLAKIFLGMAVLFLFGGNAVPILAAEKNSAVSVQILSPDKVTGIAGIDETIKAEVTNNTDQDIQNLMAYITMADMDKHMTVNLEDYGADKPFVIGTLKAGDHVDVELPVRLVYVSRYYLYTTVVSGDSLTVYSSTAIPVEILGNTMISKPMVEGIAIAVPIVTGFLAFGSLTFVRKRYK